MNWEPKMEVEVLLSCGHILLIPVENIMELPRIGEKIRCAQCRQIGTVKRVGEPYRVKFIAEGK